MRLRSVAIICAAALTICTQVEAKPKWNPFKKKGKATTEAPAPKKKSPLEKFLTKKGLQKEGNCIKIYKDGKSLFLEIPDSLEGRSVMLSSTVMESSSPFMAPGTDVSPVTNTFEISFTDTLVLFLQPKPFSDVTDGDSSIVEALAGSRKQAVNLALPVKYKSKDGHSAIVDASSLFALDKDQSIRLYAKYYDHSRIADQNCKDDFTLIRGIRSFSNSVGVEREVTHGVTVETGFKRELSGRYLTCLTLLDERQMPVRFADSRIGVYRFSADCFSGSDGVQTKEIARRWNLMDGKKITVYVDTLIGPSWRQAVKEGLEAWNPAFEEIGLGSPITVMDYPSDSTFNAEDPMVSRVTISTGKGESILCTMKYSRLSGEILAIGMDIPGCYLDAVRKASSWTISDVDTRYQPYLLPDDAVCDVLRAEMMKNFARCLGVASNAAGSLAYSPAQLRDPEFTQAHGITASVTDGVLFNYLARPGDKERGVVTIVDRIGTYDRHAIKWLYSKFPEGTDEQKELEAIISSGYNDPEYVYVPALDDVIDPRGGAMDLGNDPFEAYSSMLEHIKFAAANASEWLKEETMPQESYRELYIEWLWLAKAKASTILSPLVGGVESHDLREGCGKYSTAPGDIQKKVVKTLMENAKQSEWLLTPELREISGAIQEKTAFDNSNVQFLTTVCNKAYRVAFAEAVAGSTYSLEDYFCDIEKYMLDNVKDGKLLPGDDTKALQLLNIFRTKSTTLQAIYKKASDKNAFDEGQTAAAPNIKGVPVEYADAVEIASYRHIIKMRGILETGKAKAKDTFTRDRIDCLIGLIDKTIETNNK